MPAPVFCGSHVAIVTPMRDGGQVDWAAWGRLVEMHMAAGTAGIVVGGTTGESPTVTDDELRELVRRLRDQAGRRLQVVLGAGGNSTAATVERVRSFAALDIDAFLVVTPAYNKPTQEGLFRHFEAVAAASRVPVILYNVPGRTAVDMQPETVARLARLPRIVGIKEAVGDLGRIDALRAQCPEGFQILSGDDATVCEALGHGACGVISVTANVAPAAMSAMIEAGRQGRMDDARRRDAPLAGLHDKLFVESNPIPVKWALWRMGLIDNELRLPLTPLASRYHAEVEAALRQAGVALAAPV
ncbi:MAG: 4-hydroxy-tetrahydrodipicolinate synthase [Pseudomonadota bacterium]|jgi:4-hydroxy-tetrahydrodipicolinate synthase